MKQIKMGSTGFLSCDGSTLQTLMVIFIIAPTFLAGGYIQPFLGGVISYPSFYRLFQDINTVQATAAEKARRALIEGVVNACVNLGAVIGAVSTMYTGNKLGRRLATLTGASVNLIGTIIFVSSFGIAQLIVGRVIMGFGIGMTVATAAVWQSEISTVHKRGHHVIVAGIATGGGVALSSWVTFAFGHVKHASSSWPWRVPGIFTGFFALVIMVSTYMLPESPRWLALVNRHDQARANLARVTDEPVDSPNVTRDLFAVIRANDEAAEGASFWSLFQMGKEKMLYRVLLACSCQWYSQMSGSALITYYSKELFATVGLDKDLSNILASVVLTWKWMCCFISFFTIEMAGRRKLFLISGVGMTICMFCLAICSSQVSKDNLAPAYAGVVFAFIFVIFYPVGFLGPNYIYSQEIITTRYRAPASGLSLGVHWLTSFTVSLTTPLGFTAIGWKFYLVWGASAATSIPIVYFFYPETTGLTMEEVDEVFMESGHVLKTPFVARGRVQEARARKLGRDTERFDGHFKEEDTRVEQQRDAAASAESVTPTDVSIVAAAASKEEKHP